MTTHKGKIETRFHTIKQAMDDHRIRIVELMAKAQDARIAGDMDACISYQKMVDGRAKRLANLRRLIECQRQEEGKSSAAEGRESVPATVPQSDYM